MLKSIFLILIFFCAMTCIADTTSLLTPPAKPTKVYLTVFINNISEINSASQLMKADVFIIAKWNDPRLAHKGEWRTMRPDEDIWDPSITISNRLSISKFFSDNPTVLNDGTVFYFQRIYGDFVQNFDLKNFPMDTQTFFIRIVGIGFYNDQIEFLPEEGGSGLSDKMNIPDWKIMDFKTESGPYLFAADSQPFPSFTLSFTAKRQSGFYILIYVIPLVLIIMMSWAAFWLDPKLSSSQISIATTSMLTLIAYRFIVIGNLPKISYLTRMDIFVLCSSLMIFLTLIESVITASMINRGNEILAEKIDKVCRWVFPLVYVFISLFAFVF